MKSLVTGGTRGLGRAIAGLLLDRGDEVWITGRGSSCPDERFSGHYFEVKFEDEANVGHFVGELSELPFDVLVNNVGINPLAPLNELRLDTFRTVQQVNVEVPLRILQAVLPGMQERAFGRVVNVASVWGHRGRSGRVAYVTSKFALRGLTYAVASECASDGVLVNAVSPGFVDTDLTRKNLSKEEIDDLTSVLPIGRLASPEELGSAVIWLTSEENSYVTGQTFVVDGGFLGA